jgi:DNA-binding FadR family transcriptional regulator
MRMSRKPSLFAHVLDQIGTGIASGRYSATGMLPREPELCLMLGASRTVIREAIRVLSQKGMLQPQQKVGVRVLPPALWNLMDIDVLDWIWQAGGHEKYVRDFLEFRLTFEPMASYQAALRAPADARRNISVLCDELIAANDRLQQGGSRAAAIECDIAFHTAIFSASENHLAHYLGTLVSHMLRLQINETTDPPQEFSRGLYLHRGVADAIASGEADEAFHHSYDLVRMPYEAYMHRVFPGQPLSHANFRTGRVTDPGSLVNV